MKKEATIEQLESTEKVNRFLNSGVKREALYHKLGIHQLTFAKRLELSNWKKLEINAIKNMRIE